MTIVKGATRRAIVGAIATGALSAPALAQAPTPVTLVLNWTPTADHAPYYLARANGWYREAGLDVTIEAGRGSGASAQRVAAGQSEIGIADMATALLARSRGGNLASVMVVYANSPQGFYWLNDSGIRGPQDFPGRSIGNPPGDAARVMWPAFASRVRIDAGSVRFVNISPQAKVQALRARQIDITSDFYNEHDLKEREFGANLGFVAWRNIGLNPYGNAVIVNSDFLGRRADVVRAFVRVSQRAFHACVADIGPGLRALIATVSGLEEANQRDQWKRILELMRDPTTTSVGLGAIDPARLRDDYALIRAHFENVGEVDLARFASNDFLDTSIKMPAA